MNFVSDNAGPAHPKVMEAVIRANEGAAMPYGNDPLTEAAIAAIRDLFEAPEAEVAFVATGTTANALALACTRAAVSTASSAAASPISSSDECAAPEFFTGGAKLTLVDETTARSTRRPDAKDRGRRRPGRRWRAAQGAQPDADDRTRHGLQRLMRSHADRHRAGGGAGTHLDGARFANACAALDCTPAEMTWKAGVDVVSFGGTKNGCLGVEAVVMFDPPAGERWRCGASGRGICGPSTGISRHRCWPMRRMGCGWRWRGGECGGGASGGGAPGTCPARGSCMSLRET
jgi:threonine aldolase